MTATAMRGSIAAISKRRLNGNLTASAPFLVALRLRWSELFKLFQYRCGSIEEAGLLLFMRVDYRTHESLRFLAHATYLP